MNGYELSTPRAALALTAVALAAITMGALVVVPAELESVDADPYTLAAAQAATKAPTEAPVEAAIGQARADGPQAVDREERVHPGRTAVAAPEFRDKRHISRWHSRISTWPARANLRYSRSRDEMRVLAKERP